ncbi:hypothetical protein CVD19_00535 [Bacillus sp. T33-2]|nr:hypothetical protein CVD19_00535 [Bacillus sp. T33-2]
MFLDLLSYYIGALIYAFFIYYAVMWVVRFATRKKLERFKEAIYSFIVSLIITAILTEVLYIWEVTLIHHFPMLILVFFFDYRANKYVKCPQCAEKIKVEANRCKHCHTTFQPKEDVNLTV